MMSFRLPVAAVLVTVVRLSGAMAGDPASESPSSDTAWQHHLWSEKFNTLSDPETTGSIISQAVSSPDVGRSDCVPPGMRFSNPPLPGWRIESCSSPLAR